MKPLVRTDIEKPDGRTFYYYHRNETKDGKALFEGKDWGILRPTSWQAPHLRYDPIKGQHTAISASRNERPFLPPAEFCPLCPTKEEKFDVNGQRIQSELPAWPHDFSLAVFENIFPGLSRADGGQGPTGHCEVIIFSPEHEGHFKDFSAQHMEDIVSAWQDRSREISKKSGIEYVFLFENRGKEVGVTLHHPHGQIYAFNHVPPMIAQEHKQALEFYEQHNECLICRTAADELSNKSRVIFESDDLLAFIPYAARFPYEVHITTKSHRPLIQHLSGAEPKQLAAMMKILVASYDQLFDQTMPYIMSHHQAPSNQEDCPSYHWHVEFYPFLRSSQKLKFLAGVESGTGLFINDTVPEESAERLRTVAKKTLKQLSSVEGLWIP